MQRGRLPRTLLSCAQSLSHIQLFATPWTVARQAPLSMGIFQAQILEWVAISSVQPGNLLSSPLW